MSRILFLHRVGHHGRKPAGMASRALVLCPLLMHGAAVFGQVLPDAGTMMKQIERTEQKPPAPATPAPLTLPPQAPASEEERSRFRLQVRDFRITGATLIPELELKSELNRFVGKELNFAELRRAALLVSDSYRRKGYFARALIPAQTVQDGVVEIAVIEGRLSEIKIETLPGTRISPDRVRAYVESEQRSGDPLRPERVQSALRNLNDLPGVFTTGVIQPGTAAGDVNLSVRAEEGPFASGGVILDNYGLDATGSARLIGDASLNNPSGHGDQLAATGIVSERSTYARAGYSVPIGYSGLRIGASAARLDYRLSGTFSGFNGYGEIAGVALTHPLYRSDRANVFGGLAFDHKHFANDAAGGISISDKTLDSFRISGTGDFLDSALGGGRNTFWLALVGGRLDLSGNPADLEADGTGARTQGSYRKLEWMFTRLQTLPDKDTVLHLAVAGQQASKNLDAYERFALGGPVAVRAYPTAQALGDQGWVASLELRHRIGGELDAYGFYDVGHITVVKDPFPGSNAANPGAPNSYFLQGWGAGVQYLKAGNFSLRGVVAFKIGTNPAADANGNDIDGGHGRSRVWVQAIKFF